jgi:hypothetical protein
MGVDSALNSIDPRAGGLINTREPRIRFPANMRVPVIQSEVNCLDVFFHEDLFSHKLDHFLCFCQG